MSKRFKSAAQPQRPDPKQGGEAASERAAALKSQWTRLGRRHVLVGGACACGYGQNHMGPDDFEYFVLDHLARKYRASGQVNLVRFLASGDGTTSSLQTLLDRLTQPDTCRQISATEASLLLDDLQRSLDSFADSAI